MKIDAIGYLRTDVSGARQQWDENRIRSVAKRLGYNLRKTVTFSAHTDKPVYRLNVILERLGGIEAVFVPSVDHFGGEIPPELVQFVDVVTVDPENMYARWAGGQLPNLAK
ncbi:hypothetical protein [Nocardia sp. NPDC059239]|uniref:hypothetical protein n=1 Tax=Nocardia sp. NPDC059239 TaxID=3346785 RepID=UPI0036BF741F